MSKVTDSIGLKFERFIKESFPELISIQPNQNTPDFYHPTLNSWVEAKIGNILWGPRIKYNQITDFEKIKEPVIYALGFHNFHDANKNLIQKTEKRRQYFLDKNLHILNIYFIESDLIKKIWEKESRINEKGTENYCMVKKGIIKNLTTNRSFKRNGNFIESAEDFYEYEQEDFIIDVNMKKDNTNYGIILNKKNDLIIKYIKEKLGNGLDGI